MKIIDFGSAAIYDRKKDKKLKGVNGTPSYIAPEVFDGKYDERCDVWSIGILMYTILSGSPPFEGDDEEEIEKNVKE